MKILSSIAIFSIIASVGSSCGGTHIGNGNNDRTQVGTTGPSDDETVTIPKEINGATLTCNVIAKAQTSITAAYVGCAFVDSGSQKIDLDALASKVTLAYAVSSQEVSGVTVTIEALTASGRQYEAIAEVKGSDATVVNNYANGLTLAATATSSNGEKKAFTTAAPVTTTPAIAASNWQVVEVSSQKYAIDLQTGLKWKPYDTKTKTWEGAKEDCEASTHGGITTWRLPTLNEAYLAAANGINDGKTIDTLRFLLLGHGFWVDIPAAKIVAAGQVQKAELYDFTKALDQTIADHDIGSQQPATCVAD